MNNKGFGLTEFIAYSALLGIVLILGLTISLSSPTTALSKIRKVTDNEIKASAKEYVTDNKNIWQEDNVVCLPVEKLIEEKYLKEMNDQRVRSKSVKITKNDQNKLKKIEIIDSCNN